MIADAKQKFGHIDDAFAPVLVCQRSAKDFKVLHISAGLCRLFNVNRAELESFFLRPTEELIHPDDYVRVIRALQKGFRNPEEYQQFSYRMRIPKQEEYVWLTSCIYGYRMPDGSVLQYITSLDVTNEYAERQNRDEAFFHTSVLLEKILDTTQTALFWKDKNRRFLGANKAFLDYYGFPSEQVILGKNDEDMGWHKDEEPFHSDEVMVLTTGRSTYRVHGKCMSHGELRDIVASKSPLVENGEIVGLVGSFEDVTDEIRRQEQIEKLNEGLSKALEKAESANQAKTSFLSNVSHDMRTPLNGILGVADLALKCKDMDKIHEYLQKIMTAGSLLRDLINDTLELSRIGSGKRQMDWEVVEASHMLDRLVTSMRSAAEQNAVNFHVNLDFADLGYLRLDRLKLSKVLLNLLSNAVKFTPFDGDVWLEGSVLSAATDSCTCRFVVRDTGIGMSPHFLPKMFDPFEQENSMSEKGSMGTGLGLSIAKELLDLMDGKITVESERGKGTTFTVEIPFERVSSEEGLPEVPVEAESVSLDKRLILVCEDNELNREIVKTILEMNGMTVLTAEDGEQGVMTFIESEEYKIDAILMDIRMPVMDGLTAAAQIRQLARPDAHKVPIIALSANAFQEDVEQSRQAGMNDHLTKPVEPDLLLACLSQYVGAYDAQRKG